MLGEEDDGFPKDERIQMYELYFKDMNIPSNLSFLITVIYLSFLITIIDLSFRSIISYQNYVGIISNCNMPLNVTLVIEYRVNIHGKPNRIATL